MVRTEFQISEDFSFLIQDFTYETLHINLHTPENKNHITLQISVSLADLCRTCLHKRFIKVSCTVGYYIGRLVESFLMSDPFVNKFHDTEV
jgi:hypothetical protein